MIVVPVKEGENIEKALKKFKRKFEKTGVVKELRSRQQYDKPTVLKRLKMERNDYSIELAEVQSDIILCGANFVVNFIKQEHNEY